MPLKRREVLIMYDATGPLDPAGQLAIPAARGVRAAHADLGARSERLGGKFDHEPRITP
jgi:hypothetical protein